MSRNCENGGACHTLLSTTESILAETNMSRSVVRTMLVDICDAVPVSDEFAGCPMDKELSPEQDRKADELMFDIRKLATELGVQHA